MKARFFILARIAGAAAQPRRGSSTVELAILVPLLVFIFVLGVDWCRIYYVTHTMEDCARNGAIAGSGIAFQEPNMTNSDRVTRAKAEALKGGTSLHPPLADGDVVVNVASGVVTVTVSYTFHAVTGYLGNGGDWPMQRSVQMKVLPQN